MEGSRPDSIDIDGLDPRKPARQNLPHHPSVTAVLQYFAFAHLPPKLIDVSRSFAGLAWQVADRAPNNPETTVALRKLLEAKDAAVRAAL